MRASRRGHGADVILARGSQYSTRPASASYTFSKKSKSYSSEKKKNTVHVESNRGKPPVKKKKVCSARKSLHVSCRLFEKAKITEKQRRVLPRTCMICRLFLLTENHLHAGIYRRWRIAPSPLGTWRAGCRRYALPGRQQIPACR